MAKLREIVDLANTYKVSYLINAADTFDQKSAWRVSHSLVRQMAAILNNRHPNCRHLTVIGTHDVPTGRIERWPDQPIGMLAEAGAVEILEEPTSYHDGIIWHPVPASYDLDKDPKNYAYLGSGHYVITIAHGMIVPPGASFFGDFTDADTIETTAKMVLYGHPHTPHGIYKSKHGTIFVQVGSVSRRDAAPYNRERIPEVVLIEFDPDRDLSEGNDPKFHRIPLKSARPGSEVFSEIIRDETDSNEQQERVQQFVQNLASATVAEDRWSVDDLIAELRSSAAPIEVRQYAEEVLNEVA